MRRVDAAGETMTTALYYRWTWQLLLLLTAVLAVGSGAVRPLVGIPFFLTAFLLMTTYGSDFGNRRRLVFYGINAALLLLAVHQIMRFSGFGDLVSVMIEMICGSLPLMLLSHGRPRSYWLAVLNVTIIAVGSITLSSSVLSYAGFLALVGALLLNMNAADLYLPGLAELRAATAGRDGREDEALPRGYFWQFVQAMPLGLIGAVAIFYGFPRAQSFSLSLGQLVGTAQTGYSGVIALDGAGPIEASSELAFLVQSPAPDWLRLQGAQLLFRGDALDVFDGRSWTSSVFAFLPQASLRSERPGRTVGSDVHVLTVHREPSPLTTIFYPGVLVDVLAQTAGAGKILINANGSAVRDSTEYGRYSYTVLTAPAVLPAAAAARPLAALVAVSPPSPPESQPSPASPPSRLSVDGSASLRSVPAAVADAAWYKAWVDSLGIDPDTATLGEALAAAEAHFAQGYTASLANKFSGPNALAAFLTTDRSGHCEYFATATALLLRSWGLPARVVVGYRGGAYNHLIDALEVREENAHAWVEFLVPDAGWFALDTTPPAVGVSTGLAASWRLYSNAAAFWFRRYVVDYDQRTQRDLVRSLSSLASRDDGQRAELVAGLRRQAPATVLALAVVATLWLAARLRRRRRLDAGWPRYYVAFARRMAGVGLVRQPAETVAAFHTRLAAAGVAVPALAALERGLYQDLYAAQALSAEEQRRLAQLVARLELPQRALRRAKAAAEAAA